MKNNDSESVWEKPVIHKVLLTQVTKGGMSAGNDGDGSGGGMAAPATS
jgi:hypothetical protein